MTGKFRWTREIPPAPEWFDFDREEKMKVVMTINYDVIKKYVDRDSTGFIEERITRERKIDSFEIKDSATTELEHWKVMHPDAEISFYNVIYYKE